MNKQKQKNTKTIKKSAPKSKKKNEDPEVFVLSPDILKKLGINLHNVSSNSKTSKDSKLTDAGANSYKATCSSIETTPKNTKKPTSSLLESAILMKKSVLLSPTFIPSNCNELSGEVEIANVVKDIENHDVIIKQPSKNTPNSVTPQKSNRKKNICNNLLANTSHETTSESPQDFDSQEAYIVHVPVEYVSEIEAVKSQDSTFLTSVQVTKQPMFTYNNDHNFSTTSNIVHNADNISTLIDMNTHYAGQFLSDIIPDCDQKVNPSINYDNFHNNQFQFNSNVLQLSVPVKENHPDDIKLANDDLNIIRFTNGDAAINNCEKLSDLELIFDENGECLIELPPELEFTNDTEFTGEIKRDKTDLISEIRYIDQLMTGSEIISDSSNDKIKELTAEDHKIVDGLNAHIVEMQNCTNNEGYSEGTFVDSETTLDENTHGKKGCSEGTFVDSETTLDENTHGKTIPDDIDSSFPISNEKLNTTVMESIDDTTNNNLKTYAKPNTKSSTIDSIPNDMNILQNCTKGVEKPGGLTNKPQSFKNVRTYQRKNPNAVSINCVKNCNPDDLNIALKFCLCSDFGRLAFYDETDIIYTHVHFCDELRANIDPEIIFGIYNDSISTGTDLTLSLEETSSKNLMDQIVSEKSCAPDADFNSLSIDKGLKEDSVVTSKSKLDVNSPAIIKNKIMSVLDQDKKLEQKRSASVNCHSDSNKNKISTTKKKEHLDTKDSIKEPTNEIEHNKNKASLRSNSNLHTKKNSNKNDADKLEKDKKDSNTENSSEKNTNKRTSRSRNSIADNVKGAKSVNEEPKSLKSGVSKVKIHVNRNPETQNKDVTPLGQDKGSNMENCNEKNTKKRTSRSRNSVADVDKDTKISENYEAKTSKSEPSTVQTPLNQQELDTKEIELVKKHNKDSSTQSNSEKKTKKRMSRSRNSIADVVKDAISENKQAKTSKTLSTVHCYSNKKKTELQKTEPTTLLVQDINKDKEHVSNEVKIEGDATSSDYRASRRRSSNIKVEHRKTDIEEEPITPKATTISKADNKINSKRRLSKSRNSFGESKKVYHKEDGVNVMDKKEHTMINISSTYKNLSPRAKKELMSVEESSKKDGNSKHSSKQVTKIEKVPEKNDDKSVSNKADVGCNKEAQIISTESLHVEVTRKRKSKARIIESDDSSSHDEEKLCLADLKRKKTADITKSQECKNTKDESQFAQNSIHAQSTHSKLGQQSSRKRKRGSSVKDDSEPVTDFPEPKPVTDSPEPKPVTDSPEPKHPKKYQISANNSACENDTSVNENMDIGAMSTDTELCKDTKKLSLLTKAEEYDLNHSGEVTCGVCNKTMDAAEWFPHIKSSHNYLARIDKYPQLDMNNKEAVCAHIFSLIKHFRELSCLKCDKALKSVIAYYNHQEKCTKNGRGSVTTSIESTKDNYECGVCSEIIQGNLWRKHAMEKHYNIAWVVGGDPIDLDNVYAVSKFLIEYKTEMKNWKCNNCNESRASFAGFYAHILVCGKSDEELEKVRETCTTCNQKYLRIYRTQHKRIHKEQGFSKELKQKAEEKKAMYQEEAPQGRRHAAIKASKVLENYKEKIEFKYNCDSCGFSSDQKLEYSKHKCNKDEDVVMSESASEVSENEEQEDEGNASDELLEIESFKTDAQNTDSSSKIVRMPFKIPDPKKYQLQGAKDLMKYHYTSDSLFSKWLPGKYEPVLKAELSQYMPPVEESCQFRNVETANWTSLKKFNATKGKFSALFVGACIRTLAWVPSRRESTRESQYLAVTCFNGSDCARINYDQTEECPNMIQLWDFGDFNDKPKMAMGIAHDFGIVWSISWCPSGARDSPDSDSKPCRLGLLAAAFSNGSAYIFSVPYPSQIVTDDQIVYRLKPVAELRISSLPTSERKKYQASAINWSYQKGHNNVVVGYSDGSIAYYDMSTKSPLLHTTEGDLDVFYPFYDELAHSNCIEDLDTYPSADPSVPLGMVCSASCYGGSLSCRPTQARARLFSHLAASRAVFSVCWPSVLMSGANAYMQLGGNEMELWGGSRRMGPTEYTCGCRHCGRVVVSAPPYVKSVTSHGSYEYLHKEMLVLIQEIALDSNKTKKYKDDELGTPVEPRTYEEVVKKYGIQFHKAPKLKGQLRNKFELPPLSCPGRFPLADVAAMAFCPSSDQHDLLAFATHSGLVLLLNL